ncbi:MAG: FAD-dependent oxidoreductase [candidate division Zixibacteria bacterium]|nr:FAD-dependent oxidoreductase [candidate division Zixibacteria bacterium]
MKIAVLGGGLSGLSLAYFLQDNKKVESIQIFEKEKTIGGLCRSFEINGTRYDIGPHIIFSKDQKILEVLLNILGDNLQKIRRSNRILYKNKFVKYPFENGLSALPEKEREYCVNTFLHNPYRGYEAQNMLAFFLKTFGEGITNLYLRPYNEKIWKFDPAFMDTQMVERIPRPPDEDILKSAGGIETEGYLHQLYFYYPKSGGIQALVESFRDKLTSKVTIHVEHEVKGLRKLGDKWEIKSGNEREGLFDLVISTIPVQNLVQITENNKKIKRCVDALKYNSIMIGIVNVTCDKAANNFAFMIPEKDIIFHRLSKIDFLGSAYRKEETVTYMLEVTYRKNDLLDTSSDEQIIERMIEGLLKIGFIDEKEDVNFTALRRFPFAYVIYDLDHRKNMDQVKAFYAKEGIHLHGRFGEFEYLNMDGVIRRSMEKSTVIEEAL